MGLPSQVGLHSETSGFKNKKHIVRYKVNPINFLDIKAVNRSTGTLHPTQKPVALFEYLIKTYTNEGDLVLDNTAGSCTTAIACIRTKRSYICIEQDENYCEVGRKRIAEELKQKPLTSNSLYNK
jgi:site-specific DNA-methyltransferase (adenine-specific)